MASLRYRANGWDLRYRDREGRQRTERFSGGTVKRAPVEALERKGELEAQMYRGTYVAREARETPFKIIYHRWSASQQVSATRRHTDLQRGCSHNTRVQASPSWSSGSGLKAKPTGVIIPVVAK